MNQFKLANRVGWGNEIHIKTKKATYAGSGRGYGHGDGTGITLRKPALDEFLEHGYPTPVDVSGHCSTPYVRTGDLLEYSFCDIRHSADQDRSFKLKFILVEYKRDPSDLFFGEAILIEALGKPVEQKPKMTFFDWLFFCLSYPCWWLMSKEKRKPFDEFKQGCISHTCNFTGEIFIEQGYRFQRCKHYGCNTVNPID